MSSHVEARAEALALMRASQRGMLLKLIRAAQTGLRLGLWVKRFQYVI